MANKKPTTLFNKNHVSIVKYEMDSYVEPCVVVNVQRKVSGIPNAIHERIENRFSPLGFTYKVIMPKEQIRSLVTTNKAIRFECGKDAICLTYCIELNNMPIDAEKRPWDLFPQDKSMSDHFILDLEKEVKTLITSALSAKSKFKKIDSSTSYCPNRIEDYDMKFTQKEANDIMVDLFGHKNGVMKMLDAEKIVSHGFDIKTSFRNM